MLAGGHQLVCSGYLGLAIASWNPKTGPTLGALTGLSAARAVGSAVIWVFSTALLQLEVPAETLGTYKGSKGFRV